MNYFSIKDIERLSGIKAHTLRIWEQRHGLSFCKRKESQHRYYDNEDLKEILRIAYLYHNGYKVSKIATLSKEEIQKLSSSHSTDNSYDIYINQLIESSIDFDEYRFEKIIDNAYRLLGFASAVANVFYPFLEKIGLLWITQHVIPAQEHFSSYLIQKKILLATDELDVPVTDSAVSVLIFSPESEVHEIPLLVSQYLFKKNGFRTVYLGPNITVSELEYYCRHRPPSHLYFHFITNFLSKDAQEYINCLAEKFAGLKIIASGPAMTGVQPPTSNVSILLSRDELFQVHTRI